MTLAAVSSLTRRWSTSTKLSYSSSKYRCMIHSSAYEAALTQPVSEKEEGKKKRSFARCHFAVFKPARDIQIQWFVITAYPVARESKGELANVTRPDFF